ncbi:MAG TPA: hydroxyethylthiazole kinase [Syntrophales bacterium]|nr:hydroxyethylthiazole kinase [Syntrophales bacterium]
MLTIDLKGLLTRIREEKPLVHNITNYVVMNFTANTLLAMGASPVMAHAANEVEEMVTLARALVINIGTLSDPWIAAMLLAGRKANEKGIAVVLDPVGSGATSLRTETTRKIIRDLKLAIIRGNASEILSIGASDTVTKGVDSLHEVDQVADMAKATARQTRSVVAVTGKVDLITDGARVIRCRNGHPLMGKVTGTGCAATATIAAFATVTPNAMEAAAAGLAFFGLAGEMAAARAQSPGSFMIALIDALHDIRPEELQARALLEEG